MALLVLGLIIFLGGHSVRILAPELRERMITRHGDGVWRMIHSGIAVVGIVLIVIGYGAARVDPVVLWQPPIWARHLAALLMVPVFILIAAAYLPGRIRTTLKHPMLVGVKLWAVAHLLANGTLADIVLFGGFLGWAVADRISLKRRNGALPLAVSRPGPMNDALAIAIGLAIYALFVFYLHDVLFGVSPL